MWTCRLCDSKNEDDTVICSECGSYKEEPAYDIESDLQEVEENV